MSIVFVLSSLEIKRKLALLSVKETLPVFAASKVEFSDDEKILLEKKLYGGRLVEKVHLPIKSAIILFEGNKTELESISAPPIIELIKIFSPDELVVDGENKALLIESNPGKVQENLVEAEIVVCVGRGRGSKEQVPLARQLAEKLGAALGATRSVVDMGWMDYEQQIGLTGKTIRPKLYIGLGVSGSPQHLAGMDKSEKIVAINTDPEAPIFKIADLGIVGDLFEVVPRLITSSQT